MSYKYNNIFQIPERNLSQQRLTKVFFQRNFDLSSAEKKLLSHTILHMEIMAQILPEKSNIPAVVNDKDSYEQLLFVVCTVPDNQLEQVAERSIQFIQKYISHQMILIIEDSHEFIINTTEKRINQNDKTKLTVERYLTTSKLSKLYKNELSEPFYTALSFSNLDKTNLELLYKSYIHAIIQYQASVVTGSYQKRTKARSEEDTHHIHMVEELNQDIYALTSQMSKASQFNKKVQLNIKIQHKRNKIKELKELLKKSE